MMLVAGNRHARAVVRMMAVDQDGQVHFAVLPGSLEKNRHLIGRAWSGGDRLWERLDLGHPGVAAGGAGGRERCWHDQPAGQT